MEELFIKLKNIINNQQQNCDYVGVILYLLTSEEEPFRAYRLNLESHDRFLEILGENINKILDEPTFYHYPDCTRPDFSEEMVYLQTDEIPMYVQLRSNLINDINIGVLTRNNLDNIVRKSKGYVVRFIYEESGTSKSIFGYFRMTQAAFLQGEKLLFCFDKESEELLSEVNGVQLKFDDKLVSINIDDTMFILNGYSFEMLLKYDTHINRASTIALDSIGNKGIIENFDVLREYCNNSKPMKNKLYKIQCQGTTESIGIDEFIRVKECCGEQLVIDIDENNCTISVCEDNVKKSVDHILRVFNDESAETIVTGTKIFADKKIPM
ncbi:Kiwa anti-phage protein KwaB-like domain-containing protein [Clostridium tunisiense]|uniref:Kiwa anti-phage protein KwaB-like domain-containing protein n=1 Tax=Clostridium tunisiense TaxID=219748 RepID=UPI0002FB072D|nr:Kiwa anti-phage protein KwaB-like domain-containing protein [Clostridium tunisiense]